MSKQIIKPKNDNYEYHYKELSNGLKILLISDRVNCSPEMMELIKNDIANVISKYMKIDSSSMDIQIAKTGSNHKSPVLYANIPILDLKNT